MQHDGRGEGALRVAVLGPGEATALEQRRAEAVGFALARQGAVLICGGLGGCMGAAARGARRGGGSCVGFLPGYDASVAHPDVDLPLPTGLGEARNVLVVAAAEAAIAVGGGPGTLSEIAIALKLGRPVVGLGTWSLHDPRGRRPGVIRARNATHAVQLAVAAGRALRGRRQDASRPATGPQRS